MTLRIKGLEAGSQPTGLQAPHLDAVTRSLSHLSPFAAWSQSFVPGFLTLNPVDLSAQIIPFCGLSCALWDTSNIPGHYPRDASSSSLAPQSKILQMSPAVEVAESPLVENQCLKPLSLAMPANPWASWAHRCPRPAAEVLATPVLGGTFLLRMDSLTHRVTVLLAGPWLGFPRTQWGAGLGEERMWGSLLCLLMLPRKITLVDQSPAFCLPGVVSLHK